VVQSEVCLWWFADLERGNDMLRAFDECTISWEDTCVAEADCISSIADQPYGTP
jgi:hypothetical protein